MKIIRIVKKDSNNAVVYLDNDEKLILSFETIIKNGLKKNDEISDIISENLIRENKKYFTKQASFRLLARRLHSIKELKLKLMQKKYDNFLIDEVISELKEKNLLDDYKFSLELIDEKKNRKLLGKNRIKSILINKGIEREIISQVLENFPGEDDFENAFQLAEKKNIQLKKRNIPEEKIEQKVITFLLSRGFDYETAKDVIEKLNSKS